MSAGGGNLALSVLLRAKDQLTEPLQRADKTTRQLAETLTKAGRIDAFRALKRASVDTARKLEVAQDSVAALAREMRAAENPSQALTRSFERAKRSAGELKAKLARENRELREMRGELRGAGLASDRLAEHQRGLTRTTARLNDRLATQQRRMAAIAGLRQGMSRLAGEAGRAQAALGTLATRGAAGLGALGVAGYVFKRQFVDTASQFEKFNAQLMTLEGSSAAAQKSMDWVNEFARTTPFAVEGVMQAFVKMRAFGMDPTSGSMKAIAEQTAALGGGVYELSGIVLALGQAWTKNKLQGEEALQLIERGVPVWDLLSKATGKATAELMAMSSAGELGRKEIKLLIEQMGLANAGALAKQMATWNGMISELGDLWTRFKLMVMDAGVFDYLKERLGGFLDKVNDMARSGKLKELAKTVGTKLVAGFKQAWEVGKGLMTALQAVGGAAQTLAGILGGYGNLAIALVAMPFAAPFISLAAVLGRIAYGLAPAAGRALKALAASGAMSQLSAGLAGGAAAGGGAFARLKAGTMGLAGGLKSLATRAIPLALGALRVLCVALLTTPVGWIVGAIGLAAALIIKYWQPVSAFFGGFADGLISALAPVATAFKAAFGVAKAVLAPVAAFFAPVISAIGAVVGWLGRLLAPVEATGGAARSLGETVGRVFGSIMLAPIRLLVAVVKGLVGVFGLVAGAAGAAWDGIKRVFAWSPLATIRAGFAAATGWLAGVDWRGAASGAWGGIKRVFAWSPLGLIARGFGAATGWLAGVDWRGAAAGAWAAVKTVFSWSPLATIRAGFAAATDWLAGLDWAAYGKRLLTTLVAGIKSVATKPVEAVKAALAAVRDLLPFSDAKTGPLSELTRSGAALPRTLAAGVVQAQPAFVGSVARAAAAANEALTATWRGWNATLANQQAALAGRPVLVRESNREILRGGHTRERVERHSDRGVERRSEHHSERHVERERLERERFHEREIIERAGPQPDVHVDVPAPLRAASRLGRAQERAPAPAVREVFQPAAAAGGRQVTIQRIDFRPRIVIEARTDASPADIAGELNGALAQWRDVGVWDQIQGVLEDTG